MIAALDNDVLYKGACYGLLTDLIQAIPAAPQEIGVLTAARFVLPHRMRTARHASCQSGDAEQALHAALDTMTDLEPTVDETRLAAQLEYEAQLRNVSLDAGESQLVAIVALRDLQYLGTGDKRAIVAIQLLWADNDQLKALAGRVLCLEQLVLRLAAIVDGTALRESICAQPAVDLSLSLSFSCSSGLLTTITAIEGLTSYIQHLRSQAPAILAA